MLLIKTAEGLQRRSIQRNMTCLSAPVEWNCENAPLEQNLADLKTFGMVMSFAARGVTRIRRAQRLYRSTPWIARNDMTRFALMRTAHPVSRGRNEPRAGHSARRIRHCVAGLHECAGIRAETSEGAKGQFPRSGAGSTTDYIYRA
jgi:hypothetical protein